MKVSQLKRGIVTEELCAITDDPWEAILLKQLLYWLTRCSTIDDYLEEVGAEEKGIPKTGGWVYKSARNLGDEVMMQSSPRTVRKRLKALVEKGYVDERVDPDRKWDRRKQYRVDVIEIEKSLRPKGYTLRTVMGRDWGTIQAKVEEQVENEDASVDFTGRGEKSTDEGENTTLHARGHSTETTSENTTESVPPASEDCRGPSGSTKGDSLRSSGEALRDTGSGVEDGQDVVSLEATEVEDNPPTQSGKEDVEDFGGVDVGRALSSLDQCQQISAENWLLAVVFRDLFDPGGSPSDYVGRLGKERRRLVGVELDGRRLNERNASRAMMCSLYDMADRDDFRWLEEEEYMRALPGRTLNYISATITNRLEKDDGTTREARRDETFAAARRQAGID